MNSFGESTDLLLHPDAPYLVRYGATRREVAVHEAGHLVAGLRLGFRPMMATINPFGPTVTWLGALESAPGGDKLFAAGDAAELLIYSEESWKRNRPEVHDTHDRYVIATYYKTDPDQAIRETREWLGDSMDQILYWADRLCEEGTINFPLGRRK